MQEWGIALGIVFYVLLVILLACCYEPHFPGQGCICPCWVTPDENISVHLGYIRA